SDAAPARLDHDGDHHIGDRARRLRCRPAWRARLQQFPDDGRALDRARPALPFPVVDELLRESGDGAIHAPAGGGPCRDRAHLAGGARVPRRSGAVREAAFLLPALRPAGAGDARHRDADAGGAAAAGGCAPGRRFHPLHARPLRFAWSAPHPGVSSAMSEAEAPEIERLPVSVITGFLGSGKTTLLKHLLRQPDMADTAVVINEFGEIGLDHLLVEEAREDTILMSSGCLCCSIRGDLIDTLRRLYKRRDRGEVPRFKRLVIETTGLADPAPILQTLIGDPLLSAFYRLDGVVTTVDAVNGMDQLDRQFESVKQAAVADRLILTKTDLAGEAQRKALEARLRTLNPAAPLLPVAHGAVAAEQLFNAGLYNPAEKSPDVGRWLREEAYAQAADSRHDDHDHHGHDHGHGHGHALDVNRHDDHIRAF